MNNTEIHSTIVRSYIVAKHMGDQVVYADMLGRWDDRARYAAPHETHERAAAKAKQLGGFVCERTAETNITYTVTSEKA